MTHRSPSTFRAVLALLFFVFTGLPSIAHAQTESAGISGTVTDPTGSVVPRATVRLIEMDRGTQTDVATGNGGFYTFAIVRPGHYRIEVEKTGFIASWTFVGHTQRRTRRHVPYHPADRHRRTESAG